MKDYSEALAQLLAALRCPVCARLRTAARFAPWPRCTCGEVQP